MRQLTITSRLTNRETNSFNQYLKNIAEIAILTPSEEIALTEKTSRGDKEAIDELVCKNLRFVISVAKQYITSTVTLEDLVNEGNIGLIKAAELFKPEMGNRFISYAVWWIRKHILEYLANNGKMVRLPANKLNILSKLDKKVNELEQKLGRNVELIDIASELDEEISDDDLELLTLFGNNSTTSLDREVSDIDNSVTLSELIPDESPDSYADYHFNIMDIKSEIERMLDTLKPRDKRIMIALFGLDGRIPLGLKEVGDEVGITREMVRQIKLKSLDKLKRRMVNSQLRDSF